MASGNMKIGIITECIQQLIIKLLNVPCIVSLSLLNTNRFLKVGLRFDFSSLFGTIDCNDSGAREDKTSFGLICGGGL